MNKGMMRVALGFGTALLMTGVAGMGTATAGPVAPPPVEAFAGPPMASQLTLSPDGTDVAYVTAIGGQQHIVIRALQSTTGSKGVVIPAGDLRIVDVSWVNNRTLTINLIGLDSIRNPIAGKKVPIRYSRIMAVEKDGTNLRILYTPKLEPGQPNVSSGSILQFIDDEHVLILVPHERQVRVGKLNVYSGKFEVQDRSNRGEINFFPDPSGQLRIASRLDDKEQTISYLYRAKATDEFKELRKLKIQDDTGFAFIGFGADDKLYVASNHETPTTAVYTFDLATGTFGDRIHSDPVYDIGAGTNSRGIVTSLGWVADMPRRLFLDPSLQKLQDQIDKAIPDSTEILQQTTQDRRFSLFASFSAQNPTGYYVYDSQTKRLDFFADTYPAIPPEALGRKEVVSYKASDGLTIPAYLTLPPGEKKKGLPFVVLPHGGPTARDDQAFDQLSKFLASRGYAVLQPNFRGSTGYGAAFLEAGFNQWGGKMQTDVVEGVRWAIDQGIADPNRICIVGWSYGGYSALIGAVQDSGLFKCAVAAAPVTNLSRRYNELEWMTGAVEFNRTVAFGGNRDGLKAVSPYHQADRINIPVLLIHGDMDVQVFVEHSRDMVEALKKAGKQYEYIEIPGMDHSPSNTQDMVTVLTAWERFLKQHIGG